MADYHQEHLGPAMKDVFDQIGTVPVDRDCPLVAGGWMGMYGAFYGTYNLSVQSNINVQAPNIDLRTPDINISLFGGGRDRRSLALHREHGRPSGVRRLQLWRRAHRRAHLLPLNPPTAKGTLRRSAGAATRVVCGFAHRANGAWLRAGVPGSDQKIDRCAPDGARSHQMPRVEDNARLGLAVTLAALAGSAWRPAGAEAVERVAVLPFDTAAFETQLGEQLAFAYADVAATVLDRLGRRTVSLADIRAQVRLAEMRRLLEGCEGDACGGETQALGAQLDAAELLRGRILRQERGFLVILTRLRVDTGAVVRRFEGSAGSSSLLQATVRRGVRILWGKEIDPAATGALVISTTPPSVRVEIDGKWAGRTPLNFPSFAAGDHEVVLTSSAARISRAVLIEPGGVTRLRVDMARPPITVRAFSLPDDVEVIRAGAVVGRTPLILDDIPSGMVELTFRREGYRPKMVRVEVDGQETAVATVEAKLEARWPVAVGAILGAAADVRDPGAGVAFSGEVTVDLGDVVQLGLGGTNPPSLFGSVRIHLLRSDLELALLLRGLGVFATANDVPEDARDPRLVGMAGVTAAYTFETDVGRLGVLLESGAAVDIGGALAVPVTLAGLWRFR